MHYVDGWAWWAWIPMTVGMLAFWGLVAWAVVFLSRVSGDAGEERPEAWRESADPEQILNERLARGEIDVEEFEERLAAIRGGERAATG